MVTSTMKKTTNNEEEEKSTNMIKIKQDQIIICTPQEVELCPVFRIFTGFFLSSTKNG